MQLHDILNKFDIRDLGKVESFKNFALIRLLGDNRVLGDSLILDDALKDDRFEVMEPGNDQYTLRARNRTGRTVFVASGMVFEGDSQNRASVYPIIIPDRPEVTNIPVHCVEQGQGLISGTQFRRSGSILMASARTTETSRARTTGEGQSRTWTGIRRATMSLGLAGQNETEDYATVAEAESTGIPEYVAAIGEAHADQLGYIAAVRSNGQVFFYADMFGRRDLYQKLHQRLVQSVATVARQVHQEDIKIGKDDFYSFLTEAKGAELQKQEIGPQLLGQIYTADKPVSGVALMLEGAPVQLSLRRDEYSDPRGPPSRKPLLSRSIFHQEYGVV